MGNSASALPYTIDDETHPSTRDGSYGLSIHSGKRKSDGMRVTVFKGEKSVMAKTPIIKGSTNADPTLTQIFPALHHFSKIKTLIHPNILRVYATLDTDFPDGNDSAQKNAAHEANPSSLSALESTPTTGSLIIVTEPVIPLEEYLQKQYENSDLSNSQRQDSIAWGVRNIIQALTFLHNNAKVAHGNVNPHAIFVTPAGDFKLSALHLLTPIGIADGATGPTPHFRHFERDITPNEYRSPERIEARWDAISTSPVHVMDSYSLGVLLPSIYNHSGSGTAGQLPQKLEKAVVRLRTPSLNSRPRVFPLLKCPIFDSPHIHAQVFLEEVATRPIENKISFWKTLPDLFSKKVLSRDAAVHKVLPLLEQVIANLTTTDQALTQDIHKRECLAILPSLFTIASENLADEEFSARMGPTIELLFRVNDRAIRGALLTRISLFASTLKPAALNTNVFEPLCSGFTDSSAPLRELTLKSAIVLVEHLNPTNLEKLSRYLIRLQGDTEASIRTNTVIFIGKVAPKLSTIARSKLILPAFVRAMKDPFTPCRLAGLKAICACREFFEDKSLATEVLPVVTPSLVDNSEEVRSEATRVVEDFMIYLKEFGERMSEEERRRIVLEGENGGDLNQNNQHNSTGSLGMGMGSSASVSSSTAASTAASAPSSGGYLSGLGSWASSKITSSTMAAEETPKTTTSSAPNSAEISIPKPTTTANKTPAFSTLSLSDANIGGNAGGWSDDEIDDDLNVGISTSSNVLPSWASQNENDDDFLSQFEKKPIMRPRSTGKVGKVSTNPSAITAKRRAEMAKRKAAKSTTKSKGAMKLSAPADDINDGWDDF